MIFMTVCMLSTVMCYVLHLNDFDDLMHDC